MSPPRFLRQCSSGTPATLVERISLASLVYWKNWQADNADWGLQPSGWRGPAIVERYGGLHKSVRPRLYSCAGRARGATAASRVPRQPGESSSMSEASARVCRSSTVSSEPPACAQRDGGKQSSSSSLARAHQCRRPAQECAGPRLCLRSRRRARSATAASRVPRQSGEGSPCRGQRRSARAVDCVFGAAGVRAARRRQAESLVSLARAHQVEASARVRGSSTVSSEPPACAQRDGGKQGFSPDSESSPRSGLRGKDSSAHICALELLLLYCCSPSNSVCTSSFAARLRSSRPNTSSSLVLMFIGMSGPGARTAPGGLLQYRKPLMGIAPYRALFYIRPVYSCSRNCTRKVAAERA